MRYFQWSEATGPFLPFPCFGVGEDAATTPVLLDWDEMKDAGTLDERVEHDLAIVKALLPEAGQFAVYRTGDGRHAVSTNEVPTEEYHALLGLVQADMACAWGSYLAPYECNPNQWGCTVDGGYAAYTMLRGARLRVGQKPGRPPDIQRMTPRLQARSHLTDTHDAMVRHYKKRYYQDLQDLARRVNRFGQDVPF